MEIAFRLVGSTLPPRPICLDPPPVPERMCVPFHSFSRIALSRAWNLIWFDLDYRVWEPPCEDTDGEAEERASKATSIAVDFSWLITESRKSYTVSLSGLLSSQMTCAEQRLLTLCSLASTERRTQSLLRTRTSQTLSRATVSRPLRTSERHIKSNACPHVNTCCRERTFATFSPKAFATRT